MVLAAVFVLIAWFGIWSVYFSSKPLREKVEERISEVKTTAMSKLAISTTASSLLMYWAECGKYPASLDELTKENKSCPGWTPQEFDKPTPDGFGKELIYLPTENKFILKSLGADGVEGGVGENADIIWDTKDFKN